MNKTKITNVQKLVSFALLIFSNIDQLKTSNL